MGAILSALDQVLADWDAGWLRAEGDWARVGGAWLPLPRGFRAGAAQFEAAPAYAETGASFRIDLPSIDVVVRLAPRCRYASLPFLLRGITNEQGGRVWSAVRRGAPGYRASIWSVPQSDVAARELPGAIALDPHIDGPGAHLEVPVAAIEDYRPDVGSVKYVREGFA